MAVGMFVGLIVRRGHVFMVTASGGRWNDREIAREPHQPFVLSLSKDDVGSWLLNFRTYLRLGARSSRSPTILRHIILSLSKDGRCLARRTDFRDLPNRARLRLRPNDVLTL